MSWWQRLLQLILWFFYWRGGSLVVALGHPRRGENMANLQWPALDTDGITITVKDQFGNPAPLPDPTTVTTAYSCSDPTVVGVTPDPTTPYAAVGKSTGKAGTDLTISCVLSFNSGAPSVTGTSAKFDVPAGVISEVDVNLGTPNPPVP